MAISLSLSSFSSRIVRAAITPTGTRIFSLSGLSPSTSSGGIISFAWNGFKRFGGFLVSNVIALLAQGISWSLSTLWAIGVATFQFIWNFNWGADDGELDRQIQSGWDALGSTYGGSLGNVLGYLVCGAVPGLVVSTFNEALGLQILEKLGEAAAEEVAGNLATVIRLTATQLIKSAMIYYYKNTRNLLRDGASFIRGKLIAEGLVTPEKLAQAKKTKDEPWSFSIGFNNFVEAIPVQFIENFVEEFVEEFSDSCIESGYIIANQADSFYANANLASIRILGTTETIELFPNRVEFRAPTPSPTP